MSCETHLFGLRIQDRKHDGVNERLWSVRSHRSGINSTQASVVVRTMWLVEEGASQKSRSLGYLSRERSPEECLVSIVFEIDDFRVHIGKIPSKNIRLPRRCWGTQREYLNMEYCKRQLLERHDLRARKRINSIQPHVDSSQSTFTYGLHVMFSDQTRNTEHRLWDCLTSATYGTNINMTHVPHVSASFFGGSLFFGGLIIAIHSFSSDKRLCYIRHINTAAIELCPSEAKYFISTIYHI